MHSSREARKGTPAPVPARAVVRWPRVYPECCASLRAPGFPGARRYRLVGLVAAFFSPRPLWRTSQAMPADPLDPTEGAVPPGVRAHAAAAGPPTRGGNGHAAPGRPGPR